MDGWQAATLALSIVCVGLAYELWHARELADNRRKRIIELLDAMPTNPNAAMLGKVAQVKVYQASDWELMVIVAVSWRGAVAVRPVGDPECSARWINKSKVKERVRL